MKTKDAEMAYTLCSQQKKQHIRDTWETLTILSSIWLSRYVDENKWSLTDFKQKNYSAISKRAQQMNYLYDNARIFVEIKIEL